MTDLQARAIKEKNIGPGSYTPNPDAVLKKIGSPAVFAKESF
jgi:hypothetical protein